MPRVSKGSYVLELHRLGYSELLKTLDILIENKVDYIDVAVKPGYVYGSLYEVDNIMIYGVAPASFILRSSVSKDVFRRLSSNIYVYKVLRDTWIDTGKIDLLEYRNLVKKILDDVEIDTFHSYIIDKYVLETRTVENRCSDIYVVDYINVPLTWFNNRRIPSDPLYRELLKNLYSGKPLKYILAYILFENGSKKSITLYRTGDRNFVELVIPYNCHKIYNYIPWLILDLLLG